MFAELFQLYRHCQLYTLDKSLFKKVMVLIIQAELTVTTMGKDKIITLYYYVLSFPGSSAGKESACQRTRPRFDFWVGKFPWRRDRLPTPVLLGFSGGSDSKDPPAMWETWVQCLG